MTPRWFYFYVPRHVAGSGGNQLISKCFTTEEEIAAHFKPGTYRIEGSVVYSYSRP